MTVSINIMQSLFSIPMHLWCMQWSYANSNTLVCETYRTYCPSRASLHNHVTGPFCKLSTTSTDAIETATLQGLSASAAHPGAHSAVLPRVFRIVTAPSTPTGPWLPGKTLTTSLLWRT